MGVDTVGLRTWPDYRRLLGDARKEITTIENCRISMITSVTLTAFVVSAVGLYSGGF